MIIPSVAIPKLNNVTVKPPNGTGGFMHPESIVGNFGIKEGMKIADLGSGAGYFTILMGKIVGEEGVVTAVDIMESALDTVRSKAKNEGLQNIQTIRSNLEIIGNTGLASETQDFVLLANVLFQSENKVGILQEANRILKIGGSLVIVDWKKGTGGFGPPDGLRTEGESMRSIASGAGFELVSFIDAGAFHYGIKFKKRSTNH